LAAALPRLATDRNLSCDEFTGSQEDAGDLDRGGAALEDAEKTLRFGRTRFASEKDPVVVIDGQNYDSVEVRK
jgi:hypothetical protein